MKESSLKEKKVLIVDGGSRQCLPMIRGFKKNGFSTFVYCTSRMDLGYRYKYTDRHLLFKDTFSDPHITFLNILAALKQYSFDLVVPMNDYFATVFSKNKSELSRYARIYVSDWPLFLKATDKLETMKICMASDIDCPKTALFEDIEKFDDSLWTYPLVIKPRTSYGARGFSTVNNKKELIEKFSLTQKKFGPTLVQEYIPQDGKQYQVELLINKNGECSFFVLMEKNRWYPTTGGSSTLNTTMHDQRIKDLCLRLMGKIGWRGYASLDVIEDLRDGKPKIMEINPRINGTVKICYFAGYDVAKMIYDDSMGLAVPVTKEYEDGLRLRYFHMDVLWFLKSKKRFKAKPSWFSSKKTVDEIFSWEDIRPGLRYIFVCFGKLIKDRKNRKI